MPKSETLPRLVWLWLPLLMMAVQIVLENSFPPHILSRMHSEGGPHENLEFIILASAFLIALRILFLDQVRRSPFLTAWIGLAALCCFYVAGEEISWGQHVIHWTTPEFWKAVNDQGETNLHNTSSWLDQKPRMLLQIGVLTGGLIIPLLQKLKPSLLPARFSLIYPPSILSVTAFMAFAVNMTDRVDDMLPDLTFFIRASEVEELYMFYFVLLYMIVLRRRILQNQR